MRGVRAGSVCVELAGVAAGVLPVEADAPAVPLAELPWPDDWDALADSPLVACGVDAPWRPLRLVDGLLYLDRYHEQETQVLDDLRGRGRVGHTVDPELLARSLARVFPDTDSDEQREACRRAATQSTTVITGGPGTGKTTAVAGLLAALVEQAEEGGLKTAHIRPLTIAGEWR